MSAAVKLNIALWSFIVSMLAGGGSVTWVAATKAHDIDVCKQDISALRVDMQSVIKYTERLDERSKATEKWMDTLDSKLDSKLQGIATQLGLARSEIRQAHDN